MKKSIVLIILDGWGIGKPDFTNPIYSAKTPTINWIKKNYPICALQASGIAVGLPWGEEGNSEVGHLTLGAGRVIYQYYPRITISIRRGVFFKNPAILNVFDHAKKFGSRVHILGLLTSGNVHASYEHLRAILRMAKDNEVRDIYFHLFSDGRDSPPQEGLLLIKKFQEEIKKTGLGEIASVSGRFFAMDRHRKWDRTEEVYRLLCQGEGRVNPEVEKIFEEAYGRNISDEFIEPTLVGRRDRPEDLKIIRPNDALFFLNFREDSIEQLFLAFADPNFEEFKRKELENLFIATMTRYTDKIEVPVAYPPEEIKNSLGEVLAKRGMTQFRIAETEKYAHITYFFNGLRRKPFAGEYRVLIPSRASFNLMKYPEMRAKEITERLIQALEDRAFDFILVNFANGDSIGHTGRFGAAIKAVEFVDGCLAEILDKAKKVGAILLVTSDHGNVERMINPYTGERETHHDTNLVPFWLVGGGFELRQERTDEEIKILEKEATGILSDVAPTILDLLKIKKPEEMRGQSLLTQLIIQRL